MCTYIYIYICSGEAMADEELLELCLPASLVEESEWKLFSASRCVFWGSGTTYLQCFPRANVKAHLPLTRGTTLDFHMRPRWYIYINTYRYIYLYMYIHVCIFIDMYVCIYLSVCMHIHIYVYICECKSALVTWQKT